MIDCQPSLFSWGDASISWVAQHLRYTWLTPFIHLFSELGQVGCILFLIALSYWFWNKRYGKYLCYGMFAALYINLWIKGWVKECRPPSSFWLDKADSYSFPSGHAQIGILLWWGLAYYFRNRWMSQVCFLIGALIALSRVYLGVHYPQDIIGGALLGSFILTLAIVFEKKQWQPLKFLPLWGQLLLLTLFIICYQWLVYDPIGVGVATSGAFIGFWLGYQLEMRHLNFKIPVNTSSLLTQLFIGSIGIFIFWKGGDWLRHQLPLPIVTPIKYIQYFLLGFWIAYGAPAIASLCAGKRELMHI